MIKPVRLPKVRDRMVADLRRDDDVPAPIREATARHLGGELFWASRDMTALAVAAGRALETVRFAAEDRVAPMGLLVADGGFGRFTTGEGLDLPVDAVSWGPGPAFEGVATLQVTTWTARERVAAALTARGSSTRRLADAPALTSGLFQGVRVTVEDFPAEELPPQLATVLRTMFAAWQLMQQPTLVETRAGPVDRAVARSYQRASRPAPPAVTIVELRRAYRPDESDDEEMTDGRTFSHRWVVRGHWRNQAYGPARAQRRRTWIADHVKGPDGAPLLVRDRVNVWRR